MDGFRVDFFVSYHAADRSWAEWIAWQLERLGYRVILQDWDFRPGENFVLRIDEALKTSRRTVAVTSAAYFRSPWATKEWTAALVQDVRSGGRLLILRVENCIVPPILTDQVYVDLFGLSPTEAVDRLATAVSGERRKPAQEPPYPGQLVAQARPPRFPVSHPHTATSHAGTRRSPGACGCCRR